MSTTTRKLKGWPPTSDSLIAKASPAELAKARQTGLTVKQLRQANQRAEAGMILTELLILDDHDLVRINNSVSLNDEQRWALHLAIGVLRAK